MALRPYWKGYLKLSLVTCPVQMMPATSESEKVRFHTLNRQTQNRVVSHYVDSVTGKEVKEEDEVKGYQRGEHEYVILEDEELENVALESTKTIDISTFTPRDSIEWIWLDTPYCLSPNDPVGQEAFSVIRDAMEAQNMVGISRLVISRRERAVMLEPRGKGIVLWTLRYGDEVRDEDSYFEAIGDEQADSEMMPLVQQLIKKQTKDWTPKMVADPVQERLLEIIAAKKKALKPQKAQARQHLRRRRAMLSASWMPCGNQSRLRNGRPNEPSCQTFAAGRFRRQVQTGPAARSGTTQSSVRPDARAHRAVPGAPEAGPAERPGLGVRGEVGRLSPGNPYRAERCQDHHSRRSRLDASFPGNRRGHQQARCRDRILDGEAVVLDEEGRSDFGALQRSLGGRGGKRSSTESVFFAFDLLYFDGHDLSGTELSVRRHLLEGFLDGPTGAIQSSEEVFGDGALLEKACSMGLEGIIAKHRDWPYRSGRTGDWLKIKCLQSESFMIVGYELTARGGLGSLLLAGRKGHDWIYVGSVGTGFNTKDAEYLRKTLDRLKTSKPAVPLKGKNLVFAQPTLITEIEFRGWTHDGSLRHASYKGLREVQDNAAVFDMSERATL